MQGAHGKPEREARSLAAHGRGQRASPSGDQGQQAVDQLARYAGRPEPRARAADPLVLREELDDPVLVGRHSDLGALRPMPHLPAQSLLAGGQPFGNLETEADRVTDERLDAAAGLDRDRLAWPNLIRGGVSPLTVDHDVPVADELSSPGAGGGG